MNIMCGVFVSIAYFWVNLAGCSGKFHVFFQHLENLENLILHILKGKLHMGSYLLKAM